LYSVKILTDPSFFAPLQAFEHIPSPPAEFTSTVFHGPQATTSLPLFTQGAPTLSDPRCAWYINAIKTGTSLSSIVPDGDYARVDPTTRFSGKFPPTYFLHGKKDIFVKWEVSARAGEMLRSEGVECEVVLGEEIGHAFDLQIEDEGDEMFKKYVEPAFEWLERHV
jgi:acetyl esterase/lipase